MAALRRLLTVTAALGVLACAVAPATVGRARTAGCGGVQTASAQHWNGSLPPLAIGDSTMLLALPSLARAGFDVNAHGCRQYPEALSLLAELAHAGRLPHLIVIALGANGTIERRDIAQALRILGPRRVLVLLTPRELGGGSGSDAQLVRAESRRHGEDLIALDWVAYSAAHPQWFEPDGLHVNPTGAAAMSRLIVSVRPLARAPRPAPVPGCHQPTQVPTGAGPEPSTAPPPEKPLGAIGFDTHGPALRVDRRRRRLRIPVVNANAYQVDGLARVESDGPGRTLLAATCFAVPAGAAQLEVPLSRALVADAELLARFKVRLTLELSSLAGASGRINASYVLRP